MCRWDGDINLVYQLAEGCYEYLCLEIAAVDCNIYRTIYAEQGNYL